MTAPRTDWLSRLVSPLDRAAFLHDCWERRPLWRVEPDAALAAAVLDLAGIDAVLARAHASLRFPSIMVKEHGAYVGRERFTMLRTTGSKHAPALPDLVDTGKVLELFEAGDTVVLYSIDQHVDAVAAVCDALSRDFRAPVQANLYLSPPRCEAGALHFDAHDVFVLHLHGAKTWHVYDAPEELPVEPRPVAHADLKPLAELTLTPGSTLYLPRGFPHATLTAGEPAAHLTFSLAPGRTWASLLVDAVKELEREDPRLRRAVPLADEPLAAGYESLTAALAALDPQRIAAKLEARNLKARPRRQEGRLAAICGYDAIGPDSRVQARFPGEFVVERGAEAVVTVPGHTLSVGLGLAAAVERLLASERPLAATDLAGLASPELALALVRKLCREGIVLTVAEAEA